MGRRRFYALLILLSGWILVFFAWPLQAGEEDIRSLRREMEAIRGMMERLDERVKALESVGNGRSAAPSLSPDDKGGWKARPGPQTSSASGEEGLSKIQERAILERWKRLKQGMSSQDVEGILGKPMGTTEVDRQTVWYYRYDGVGASVVFTEEGRLSGFQKPPFGLFW